MNAKNKTKQSDTCCGSQCVCLELARPDAQEVSIAGSFNDWHPSVTPMIRLSDGKWVDDPAATELIPNPFGTANAVLVVAASKSPVAARPASASPATRRQAPSPKSSTPRESCCA